MLISGLVVSCQPIQPARKLRKSAVTVAPVFELVAVT